MKKVKLSNEHITPELDLGIYKICLGDYDNKGNIKKHYFSSKEKSQNFIKKTNKFLTDNLHELNMLYARIFFEYRVNWAISTTVWDEREITQLLSDCDTNFNRVYDLVRVPKKGSSGSFFRLLKLNCEHLSEVVNILIKLNKKSSTTANIYSYKFILNDILRVKEEFENYSNETPLLVLGLPEKNKPSINPELALVITKHNKNVRRKNARIKKKIELQDRFRTQSNNDLSRREVDSISIDRNSINT